MEFGTGQFGGAHYGKLNPQVFLPSFCAWTAQGRILRVVGFAGLVGVVGLVGWFGLVGLVCWFGLVWFGLVCLVGLFFSSQTCACGVRMPCWGKGLRSR